MTEFSDLGVKDLKHSCASAVCEADHEKKKRMFRTAEVINPEPPFYPSKAVYDYSINYNQ